MDLAELLRSMRPRNERGRSPRAWYSMKNLASGEAEIFIYDVIGDSWFGGVTAADFVRELRGIVANKILLRINSPGGAIADAVAIRTALDEHPAEIATHIDGIAASAASWVGLGANTVIIAPHATMMIHEPFDFCAGDAAAMRKYADMLDMYGGQIADMLAEKAGGTADEWRERMREETWYTDQEAVDAGLADEIAGAPAAENRYDASILNIFKHTPDHLVNGEPENPRKRAPAQGNRSEDQSGAADLQKQPDPELVRAALEYQREQSRLVGVA